MLSITVEEELGMDQVPALLNYFYFIIVTA